jgi:hypothetical protein
MLSGSGFFYFENGEKAILSGLKGNVIFTSAIRQPLMAEFAMLGSVAPVTSQAAIGYTPAVPGFGTAYPMCVGITLKAYIPCEVDTGATTTSIPLRYTDDSASSFEVTANTDKLIVDYNGSASYETKTITAWNYNTQTATVAALSGAPSAGNAAYI